MPEDWSGARADIRRIGGGQWISGGGAGGGQCNGDESLSGHRAVSPRCRLSRIARRVFGPRRGQHEAADARNGGGEAREERTTPTHCGTGGLIAGPMSTRAQNERKFGAWTELADGGRRYWHDVPGRLGWLARYVKDVD